MASTEHLPFRLLSVTSVLLCVSAKASQNNANKHAAFSARMTRALAALTNALDREKTLHAQRCIAFIGEDKQQQIFTIHQPHKGKRLGDIIVGAGVLLYNDRQRTDQVGPRFAAQLVLADSPVAATTIGAGPVVPNKTQNVIQQLSDPKRALYQPGVQFDRPLGETVVVGDNQPLEHFALPFLRFTFSVWDELKWRVPQSMATEVARIVVHAAATLVYDARGAAEAAESVSNIWRGGQAVSFTSVEEVTRLLSQLKRREFSSVMRH